MQRRRFIQVVATSLAGLSLGQLQAGPLKPLRWRGYTLGAEGQFTLYTDNRTEASSILEACFAEIQRLEKCFSLYDARSELSQAQPTRTTRRSVR
jgi:thiamine biosynthesis lipoprotein ApbE